MTDGRNLDRPPSSTTALSDLTSRVKRDNWRLVDEGDWVIVYQDQMLHIHLSERPLVLRLTGQADLSHRGALEKALRYTEQGVSDVLVDLTQLEFIDVGCVRQLIDHAGVLAIDGRNIRIAGAHPNVVRVFHVCLWPKPPPNLRVEDARGRDLVHAPPAHLDGRGDEAPAPLR